MSVVRLPANLRREGQAGAGTAGARLTSVGLTTVGQVTVCLSAVTLVKAESHLLA